MDHFFREMPSTSGATANPVHEGSQATEDLSRGDATDMNLTVPDQPSSIDEITNKVEELVERINTSRASDQKVMDSFQEKLTEMMSEMCQQLKDHMYTVYEDNSIKMQVKLREVSEVLENCSRLNQELQDATQALSSLRDSV